MTSIVPSTVVRIELGAKTIMDEFSGVGRRADFGYWTLLAGFGYVLCRVIFGADINFGNHNKKEINVAK